MSAGTVQLSESGVLSLAGILDYRSGPGLRKQGGALIASSKAGELVLDCTAVEQSSSVGLSLLLAFMRDAKAAGKGFEVFLDLKFQDIPNTTAMAVKAAAEMGVWMVNVHCSGGLRMMAACRETLDKLAGAKPLLIGVTVLTSMEREDLAGIGLDLEPQTQVLRLAGLAAQAGLDGLVCSAQEAQALKAAYPALQLVTPGIRPAGSAQDDQRRILTPRQALDVGSDYLVIGRPISQAANPSQALAAVVAELACCCCGKAGLGLATLTLR